MSSQTRQQYKALDALHDWFVGGSFRREVSAFAADGMGIVAMSTQGRLGHVEFDFFRIWEAMKTAPKMPKKVWMFHTHSMGCNRMSGVDANAVKGWVTALGMPIEMCIVTELTMRYLCLKGNVIVDLGFRDGPPSENLLVATLCGLSWAPVECSQSELDSITDDLNLSIPTQVWDCDYRAGLDAVVEQPSHEPIEVEI